MPGKLLRACRSVLGDQVCHELLQSQIEVSTKPCTSMEAARDELSRLRRIVAEQCGKFGLGIVASGTHPTARWDEQLHTQKPRYGKVMDELQMLGLRNMVCGLHVHVEIDDPDQRIDIMGRMIPFLPLLYALSTSSPFWQGRLTGLHGYRLAMNDEQPRSGFPPRFQSWRQYRHYVDVLVESRVIRDASYIWWLIRPSERYPTLELRISDCCPHVADTLCIAALYRCLVRHLARCPTVNAEQSCVTSAIVEENRWRAQRYGTQGTTIDPVSKALRSTRDAIRNLQDLIAEDAVALGCEAEIRHAETIMARGTSSDLQAKMYHATRKSAGHQMAIKAVVDWLRQTTVKGANVDEKCGAPV